MSESLREQLEANFDKIVARDEGDAPPPPASETPAAPTESAPKADVATQPEESAAEKTERLGRTAGRARDEKGRLLPGPAKRDDLAAPAAPAAAQAAPQATQPAPAAPPPVPRPSSWEKAMWPVWDKLNAGVPLDAAEARKLAEYQAKREADYTRGVSTYKQEWDRAKPILDAITPFQPLLQQHGITPERWISGLGQAHQILATGAPQQKIAAFAKLAQDYGVPLQALYDQAAHDQYLGSQPAQPQLPPNLLTREEAMRMFQEQFAQTASQQEIAHFQSDGRHPHFDEVRETMAGLLQANLADDLESAYEAALRHPRHAAIAEAAAEQQRAAQAAEQARKAKEEAERARRNAVSTRTATPAGQTASPNKGLRATLESAFDEHTAGRV